MAEPNSNASPNATLDTAITNPTSNANTNPNINLRSHVVNDFPV